MSDFFIPLTNLIAEDLGPIMGVIIPVLAAIMNVIMNVVAQITERHSLGITIILMTLVIRVLMLPQGIQMIKSQKKQRAAQPEIKRINEKYGSSRDREVMAKKNAELQEVYRKNKINPLGGCLPLLITMPIFIALIDLLRRLPQFITRVRDLYYEISYTIISVPGMVVSRWDVVDGVLTQVGDVGSRTFELAFSRTSPAILTNFAERHGENLSISNPAHLSRFLDTFSDGDWNMIKDEIAVHAYPNAEPVLAELNSLLIQRDNFQTFLGLNLVENINAHGIFTPALIIPILSAGTSFLLSWVGMKANPMQDQTQKMQRMMMLVAMPLMMFFFTFNISGGVGVYWIASNITAIIQQILLTKFFLNRKQPDVVVETKK